MADVYLVHPEPDMHGFPGRYIGWPWVTPFAKGMHVTRDLLRDSAALPAVTERLVDDLKAECTRDLRTMLTTVNVVISDGATADLFTRNMAVVLAEVITLNRAEPMPWPTFTPYPRIDRAGRWLKAHWPPRLARHDEDDW